MDQIKWAEIEAECGDYRSGFIAVFRKYEGMETDERTKQGRVVKVTAPSFARHMRIPEATFKDWLKRDDGGRLRETRDRTREDIKRMPKQEKKALALDLIEELREEDEKEDREKRAQRRAVRKEHHEDGDRTGNMIVQALIGGDLDAMEIRLRDAIRRADDVDEPWTEEETAPLVERIERDIHWLDVLKMALQNRGEITDEDLNKLTGGQV